MNPLSTRTQSESYLFDPRPNYPFLLTAKRYWKPSATHSSHPDALTLICTHGTGFHKELWEPTLEYLWLLDGVKVREIWSIDAPNHGDAAIHNEDTLQWGYDSVFGWEEYGRGVHAFLAGLGIGVDVDFSSRNLVGVGHSMGAVALILSTTFQPPIHYTSLQLIEPMLIPKKDVFNDKLIEGALRRRDVWPSKQDAFETLRSRPAFKIWDELALRIFVEHGLKPLQNVINPAVSDGVTLKCSKTQEVATYRDWVGRFRAYHLLPYVLRRFPTHIIYGDIGDLIPSKTKEHILNEASGGIENFASVARVIGAGHLVVQTEPSLLAAKIRDALVSLSLGESRAKL